MTAKLLMYLVTFLCLLGLFFCQQSWANDIKLDDFYLEYGRYVGGNSHHLAPGYETKQLPALGWQFKAYKWAYMTNKISTEVDDSQFRYVALDSELGLKPTSNIELYYRHYSGHALDSVYKTRYPSDDSVGFRIHFRN